jgi:hypothetical protein
MGLDFFWKYIPSHVIISSAEMFAATFKAAKAYLTLLLCESASGNSMID